MALLRYQLNFIFVHFKPNFDMRNFQSFLESCKKFSTTFETNNSMYFLIVIFICQLIDVAMYYTCAHTNNNLSFPFLIQKHLHSLMLPIHTYFSTIKVNFEICFNGLMIIMTQIQNNQMFLWCNFELMMSLSRSQSENHNIQQNELH